MTKDSGGATVDQGGASTRTRPERDSELDIAGDAAQKGERRPPADRDRVESSGGESGGAIDMDTARDRAG